ncbi:hypothetical protein [Paractinoplanes brasiliensis]|uniref:Uncharacterized protein n=1 Tax=Paractinoplanes brasiliensis TaxID=52695 RepID=A0A4R6K0X0_9ACTN|nr:hypothetical protein [Actinoplanes brasiliensis]TDO42397.1 hypothetical protein C8E87_6168 [Actinoplanes brasiliensis]GID29631.1 hypothetical protein Abr02nite_46140 [Actinoplanes brasiliensis]
MRRWARGGTRIGAVLVVVATLAWASPALADVPGFEVEVGQSPGTFTTGKDARTLTAVASTDRGRRCLKVRWALSIETEGVSLDQVRVTRVENGRSFDVRAGVRDETATVVDEQPDPGQLCQGRTVTGRWDIAFTGPDNGEVTFLAQAFDAAGRLLSSAGAQSRVVGPVAAEPTRSPSPTPSAVPTEDAPVEDEEPADEAAPAGVEPTGTGTAAFDPAASSSNVLGVGLAVGALLVFLGVGMLLRLRMRNRQQPAWQTETQALPTGFESMPRRRRT